MYEIFSPFSVYVKEQFILKKFPTLCWFGRLKDVNILSHLAMRTSCPIGISLQTNMLNTVDPHMWQGIPTNAE